MPRRLCSDGICTENAVARDSRRGSVALRAPPGSPRVPSTCTSLTCFHLWSLPRLYRPCARGHQAACFSRGRGTSTCTSLTCFHLWSLPRLYRPCARASGCLLQLWKGQLQGVCCASRAPPGGSQPPSTWQVPDLHVLNVPSNSAHALCTWSCSHTMMRTEIWVCNGLEIHMRERGCVKSCAHPALPPNTLVG